MQSQDPAPRPRGRPRTGPEASAPTPVRALDRGLILLKALADDGGASLSELASRTTFPVSTVHRLLATLQQHGFVELNQREQKWQIAVEAFRVGNTYMATTNLVELALIQMRLLMEETGETANLAIVEGNEVVFVSQVESRHAIRAFHRPGSRGHLHASGIGKALLGSLTVGELRRVLALGDMVRFTDMTLTNAESLMRDLESSRRRGWALDDEERYAGMRCIAAPVFNMFGEAVAGISISGPTSRLTDDVLDKLGETVKTHAEELTARLRGEGKGLPISASSNQ